MCYFILKSFKAVTGEVKKKKQPREMGAFLTKEEQTQQKVIFYTATVTENVKKMQQKCIFW